MALAFDLVSPLRFAFDELLALADTSGDAVADGEAETVALGDAVTDGETLAETVALGEGETVAETDAVAIGDAVAFVEFVVELVVEDAP